MRIWIRDDATTVSHLPLSQAELVKCTNSPRRVELEEPYAVGVVLSHKSVEIRLRQLDDGGMRWPTDDDVGDGATKYDKRRYEEGDGDGSHCLLHLLISPRGGEKNLTSEVGGGRGGGRSHKIGA